MTITWRQALGWLILSPFIVAATPLLLLAAVIATVEWAVKQTGVLK